MFGHSELASLLRIILALQHPQGPHIVVIAAEGGMGKSTIAAKVVRSLFEEQLTDEILGDNAKMAQVNPATGEITRLEQEYYDWKSCCAKLYVQLGLPPEKEAISMQHGVNVLRNRLIRRKAVIVVDNLESVAKSSQLLYFLRPLASQNVRIIVTTRTVQDIYSYTYRTLVVNLRSITTIDECRTFLCWYIGHFQQEYAELRKFDFESVGDERLQYLIERTGGIPLLLQLIIRTIARLSWAYLDDLPNLLVGIY